MTNLGQHDIPPNDRYVAGKRNPVEASPKLDGVYAKATSVVTRVASRWRCHAFKRDWHATFASIPMARCK